jgi:hypothetical protein
MSISKLASALTLVTLTGCCSGIVSQRYHDSPQALGVSSADCTDGGELATRPAGDLHSSLLSFKHQFRAALQPEPPAFEPPRSRFHPVPTQPVFAPRAEYSPPQPLATALPFPGQLHPVEQPTLELLPTPAPKPLAPPSVKQTSALSPEPNPLR